MSSDKLRVALIGAAGKVAAPCHLHAWQLVDRGELVAVCDVDQRSVDQIGDTWGIKKRYTSYEALLEDPEIDAVDIVTPPFVHANMTLAAAAAGKHIYVEKPMARSTGEARSMIDSASASGVTLMVGESYVFQGSHVMARKLIDAGEIGDVLHVRQTKGPWVMRPEELDRLEGKGHFIPWRVDPELSGGGPYPWLMDHGAHFFATARYLAVDEPIDAVSTLAVDIAGTRDEAVGEARQDSVFSVSWRYANPSIDGLWTRVSSPPEASEFVGFRTEIFGQRGMIRVFGEGGGAPAGREQPPPVSLIAGGSTRTFDPNDGEDRSWFSNVNYYDRAHANALQHFVDSISDGSPPRYGGEDGAADIGSTLASIKSAIDGAPVRVADLPLDWTAYGA
ncbi:MAG: Gfo/Idh/MocA family oxidoreductase [Chloroflexi bacterium]|nr:Gfo/Idh/MocA family oxidoreductase [Chloroflexota bacterium]